MEKMKKLYQTPAFEVVEIAQDAIRTSTWTDETTGDEGKDYIWGVTVR